MPQQDPNREDPSLGSPADGRARKVKRLTDYEKSIVARRAYGEYAIDQLCTKIWRTHGKKNRNPGDQIYLKFLRLIHAKKSYSTDEYQAVAQPVGALHPDPWGLADYKLQRELDTKRRRKKPAVRLKRRDDLAENHPV